MSVEYGILCKGCHTLAEPECNCGVVKAKVNGKFIVVFADTLSKCRLVKVYSANSTILHIEFLSEFNKKFIKESINELFF